MNLLGFVTVTNGTGSLKCTIPKGVVNALGLVANDKLLFCVDGEGNVIVKKNGVK